MTLSPELVEALGQHIDGRVVGADDPSWDAERGAWHLLADQRPAAVVHVTSAEDIAAAVRFARRHELAVSAQPVGHGATPALNGTILLRTGGLTAIDLDLAAGVVRVEAGVRCRDLNKVLTGTGLSTLPGSSGDPTVVGYTLGGGVGWFARKYGQAANHVRSFELINAFGDRQRVTRESDPELFWALRGGGGEFGIIIAMELELVLAPAIYGGRMMWPIEHARAALQAFTDITATAPEELTLWAWLLNLPDLPDVPPPLRGQWVVAVDACSTSASPRSATASTASTVKPAGNTDSCASNERSAEPSRSQLQSRAPRSVRCRGIASRSPPVSTRRLSSSRTAVCAGDRAGTQAAASSIASGTPSSRSQIRSMSARFASVSSNPYDAAWARSTNSRTASPRGGTVKTTSPGLPSASWLVARMVSDGQDRSNRRTSRATGSSRCSQLSITSRRRRPASLPISSSSVASGN